MLFVDIYEKQRFACVHYAYVNMYGNIKHNIYHYDIPTINLHIRFYNIAYKISIPIKDLNR